MPPGIRQTGMVPLDLYGGARIVLEARDPATGDEVGGVNVSRIVLYSGDPSAVGGPLDESELAVWLQSTAP